MLECDLNHRQINKNGGNSMRDFNSLQQDLWSELDVCVQCWLCHIDEDQIEDIDNDLKNIIIAISARDSQKEDIIFDMKTEAEEEDDEQLSF